MMLDEVYDLMEQFPYMDEKESSSSNSTYSIYIHYLYIRTLSGDTRRSRSTDAGSLKVGVGIHVLYCMHVMQIHAVLRGGGETGFKLTKGEGVNK